MKGWCEYIHASTSIHPVAKGYIWQGTPPNTLWLKHMHNTPAQTHLCQGFHNFKVSILSCNKQWTRAILRSFYQLTFLFLPAGMEKTVEKELETCSDFEIQIKTDEIGRSRRILWFLATCSLPTNWLIWAALIKNFCNVHCHGIWLLNNRFLPQALSFLLEEK